MTGDESSITCQAFCDALVDAVDVKLPAPLSDTARAHSASCPACAMELESYRKTVQWCKQADFDDQQARPGPTDMMVMDAVNAARRGEPPRARWLAKLFWMLGRRRS